MKKMRRIRLTLVMIAFLFIRVPLSAQNGHDPRQSNSHGYAAGCPKDTTYIDSMIGIAWEMKVRNIDSALLLYRIAIAHSISLSYHDGAASALLGLSAALFNFKNDVVQSQIYMKQAYALIQQSSYRKGKLLEIYYLNMMSPSYVSGKYDSLAYFCHKALEVIETYHIKDTTNLIGLYCNLSIVYNATGQSPKARYYLKKAEALAFAIHNEEGLIRVYANMAATCFNLNDYLQAIRYGKAALDILNSFPESIYIGARTSIYQSMGQAYLGMNRPHDAILSLRSSLDGKNVLTDVARTESLRCLAQAYYQLQDYRKAEQCLSSALAIAKEGGVGGKTLKNVYDVFADLYQGPLQDFKRAYYYKDLAKQIQDSLFTKEKLELTNTLEVKYRTAEKDKEIAGKQLLLTKRSYELSKKNHWIVGISVTLLLLLFLLGTVYKGNKHKQQLQLERINTLQQEREISNLKSAIAGEEKERSRLARDLHDGIMVLFSAIKMKVNQLPKDHQSLKQNDDFSEITYQLDYAIKELRRTAHNLMPDMLLDGGLAEAVFYFCRSLQSKGLSITFQQYGEIPRLSDEVELFLYRIVQELLQNIIKHADATEAIVQLNHQDHLLCITIEDNGKGFDHLAEGYNGAGLKGIKNRVRALNGIIDISSDPDMGTTIYLEFDIRSAVKIKLTENAY